MAVTENIFLKQLNKSKEEPSQQEPSKSSENRFLKQLEGKKISEPKEGLLKSIGRFAYQIPAGVAQKYTWPLNLLQLAGTGEALAEFEDLQERLPELMEKFPDAPWENFKGLDKEKYMQAVQAASDLFPTQQNIERVAEEKTGLPLEPKGTLQELTRLGSTAAAFRPGDLASKATAAVTAPAVKSGLHAIGVPEPLAEVGGLLASGGVPTPSLGKITKPSGIPARRFEKISKQTTVSAGRQEAIKEAIETDFRKISDQILEKRSKTYSAMKEDNLFKEKIGDLFEKVEGLAEEIPGEIHTEDLRKAFKKRYNARESTGVTPDEFERSFRKEVRGILKEIPFDEMTASQLVEQFRKNNKSLRELFEPGKSSAYNRAKKESLLEYNRAIEDVINNKYPDTEFKDLFEFTNKRWSEISDIEQIDKFVQDVVQGKIDYGKAKQIFNKGKEHIQRPFKRTLGEEGFEEFKQLTNDLLSTEKSMGYIKKAKDAGFDELAKTASLYLISPKVGATRTLSKAAKALYQMSLDKPQVAVKFNKAMESLKAGNYAQAAKYFNEMDLPSNPK